MLTHWSEHTHIHTQLSAITLWQLTEQHCWYGYYGSSQWVDLLGRKWSWCVKAVNMFHVRTWDFNRNQTVMARQLDIRTSPELLLDVVVCNETGWTWFLWCYVNGKRQSLKSVLCGHQWTNPEEGWKDRILPVVLEVEVRLSRGATSLKSFWDVQEPENNFSLYECSSREPQGWRIFHRTFSKHGGLIMSELRPVW